MDCTVNGRSSIKSKPKMNSKSSFINGSIAKYVD